TSGKWPAPPRPLRTAEQHWKTSLRTWLSSTGRNYAILITSLASRGTVGNRRRLAIVLEKPPEANWARIEIHLNNGFGPATACQDRHYLLVYSRLLLICAAP